MGEGLLSGVTGEEAGDLCDAVGPLNANQARLGDIGLVVAAHHVVDGALHRHLCKVRDHDHLMCAGKIGEHLRKRSGRGTAYAGIDLIENEGVDRVGFSKDHFGRKHDA